VLARCPSCRQTFSTERAGQQDCPHCKRPLIVPGVPAPVEAAPAGPQPFATPAADQDVAGTPWERRAELGFVSAWWQTVSQALFEPGRLFASARLDRGPAQLGFAVLTWSVFSAFGQILDRLLFANQREQAMKWIEQLKSSGVQMPPFLARMLGTAGNDNSIPVTIGLALLAPLVALVFVYASAGITHGSAMLTGQSRRGFAATFAATTYAFAPFVLLGIPGCGGIVAIIWCVVLTGIGLNRMHRITPKGAAAAVLAPYFLFCCGGCLLSATVGALFGRVVGGGGMP
jgi:hypothetical protein